MSYVRMSQVYDLIYTNRKDYAAEAAQVARLIGEYCPPATSLLDVACGTGLHDQYLARRFALTGTDLSPEQLAVARQRLPDVALHLADMRTMDLGSRFDAVTCLFSAIGHMTTIEDLQTAISTMARHLSPAGVLIIEPWLHPEDVIDGKVSLDQYQTPDVSVQRTVLATLEHEGQLTHLEMHHLVGHTGHSVEHFIEDHLLGNYTVAEYLQAIRQAGLAPHHLTPGLTGRGLFIGVAP